MPATLGGLGGVGSARGGRLDEGSRPALALGEQAVFGEDAPTLDVVVPCSCGLDDLGGDTCGSPDGEVVVEEDDDGGIEVPGTEG